MINILTQIKNATNLSTNEQLVANYIIDNPHQAIELSAKEISKACFVSLSSVYRLCDKLGIEGLHDLKLRILASLKDYDKENTDFDFNFPIKQDQSHFEIAQNLKSDYEQTMAMTFNLFNLDQLKLITYAMKQAKYIDIYTSAGNIYFAQNFAFQMQEIGVRINVPIEEYQQRLTAASSNNEHLAIIISFGGRGFIAQTIPKILKENKTKIVLVSSVEFNGIEADYHLYISPNENHYKKISSFSTRMSILYILDVLYTCYFGMNYDKNLENKMKYYSNIAFKIDK